MTVFAFDAIEVTPQRYNVMMAHRSIFKKWVAAIINN